MNDYRWYYGFGAEPERYYGAFDSRLEAVTEGLKSARADPERYEELTVLEGRQAEIDAYIFDASELMEQLCEYNDEIADEDGDLGLEERTAQQEHELEQSLGDVLKAWMTKHQLGRAWAFADTRNQVVLPITPEQRS